MVHLVTCSGANDPNYVITAPATPATCSTPATQASGAGTYPVTCSGAADANYDISYAAGALEVTKAALTVSAEDHTRQLGQDNPALTVSSAGFVLGQTLGTSGVTGAPACTSCSVSVVTALLNLGSYSATYDGNATYLPSSATGSVTLF